MTNKNSYTVRPYTHEFAAPLTLMWNESDDQWPGTFNRGVPMTEDRIVKWMDEETCLMRLIVVADDGGVVAYGNLREEPGQEGVSAYVPLLNVHPQHQGKSLCRRMLTKMVDWAAENGYPRMSIGTWSGNLKSVPLYKKVGFFWRPETSVNMENYVPAARQLPIAQPFFAEADWYRDFKRELCQVEDEQRHPATGDMKVYIQRWEHNGRFVETIYDKLGQSLTGFANDDLSVYAVVSESEPAQGLEYDLAWQISNQTEAPVPVTLSAFSDEGIDLTYQDQFTLAAGETRQIEAAYTCAENAPKLDLGDTWRPKPTPHIHTQVTVGGAELVLATGLNYRPAVEVSLNPDVPTLIPGQIKPVLVQLHNRLKRPLTGILHLSSENDLITNWQEHEFSVEAESFTGIPLELQMDQAGGTAFSLQASFQYDEQAVSTSPQKTAVLAVPLGGIAASMDEDDLYIENDFYKITALKKGGQIKVWNKAGHQPNMWLREEVGPPFSPSELEKKEYVIDLETGPGFAKAIFRVISPRFPGLTIIRELLVTPSPIMQILHQVEYRGQETVTCKVQTYVGLLDLDWSNGRVAMPRQQRLITDWASRLPTNHNDFPEETDKVPEQWLAFNLDGQIHGVIWPVDTSEHPLHWGSLGLHSREMILEPGDTAALSPVYLYCGPGQWQDVRHAWKRLVGVTESQFTNPDTGPAYTLTTQPNPVLTLTDEVAVTIQADNVRDLELNGRITIQSPAGWTAEQIEIPVEKLTQVDKLQTSVIFQSENGDPGPTAGQMYLETTAFDEIHPFTIIRLGDGTRQVEVHNGQAVNGAGLWTLQNGRCQWVIAPDYHAGIIAWREKEGGANHLLTSYPDENFTFSGFQPWFGGIQPILRRHLEDWENWPGKFYQEQFISTPINAPDEQGLPWRGLQLATTPKREGFEGLRAEIVYLTLPGSNLLKLVLRVVNETAVYRQAVPGFQAYFQLDGEYKNGVMYGDTGQNKRTELHRWIWQGNWSAVVNPDTGRTAAVISASGLKRTHWLDWGEDGGHVMVEDDVKIPPYSQHKLTAYIALTDSVTKAKQYATLSDVR